jgi:hypothetical protein
MLLVTSAAPAEPVGVASDSVFPGMLSRAFTARHSDQVVLRFWHHQKHHLVFHSRSRVRTLGNADLALLLLFGESLSVTGRHYLAPPVTELNCL